MTAETARNTRRAQSAATRERLLDVAVAVLIDEGAARTTTVEVQARAGVSRGALLHHFPTHATLLSAMVARLVQMNEAAVWREAKALSQIADPVERVIRTLANAFAHPSFAAELELWAVARTNAGLRLALRQAEGQARDSRDRVLDALFAPLEDRPATLRALSVEFLRGLALTQILRHDSATRDRLVSDWIEIARGLVNAGAAPSR